MEAGLVYGYVYKLTGKKSWSGKVDNMVGSCPAGPLRLGCLANSFRHHQYGFADQFPVPFQGNLLLDHQEP